MVTLDTADSVRHPSEDQMNARREWVRLLREKKYKKWRKSLGSMSGKSRCCLGVACDIEVIGVEIELKHYIHNAHGTNLTFFDGNYTLLPNRAQRALGLKVSNPRVLVEGEYYSLAELNDAKHTPNSNKLSKNRNWSHPQIADLIEATYITPYLK